MAKKAKITIEEYSDRLFKEFWAAFEKEYIETGKTKQYQAGNRIKAQTRRLDRLDRETRRVRKTLEGLA
jgi:hypothetical protein